MAKIFSGLFQFTAWVRVVLAIVGTSPLRIAWCPMATQSTASKIEARVTSRWPANQEQGVAGIPDAANAVGLSHSIPSNPIESHSILNLLKPMVNFGVNLTFGDGVHHQSVIF